MKKKFTITFAGLLAIGMLALHLKSPQAAKAQGTNGCQLTSVKGNFGFSTTGWSTTTGVALPVATVGRLQFNGTGVLTGTSISALNGAVSEADTMTGTYTVDRDCTGTATFVSSSGRPTVDVALMIVSNGAQIDFIQTDNGNTVTGTANLQGEGPH